MKINFTKKEYGQLIEMVFLADWMTSAHIDDDTQGPYYELAQKLYAYAKDFGMDDKIEFVKALNCYCETAQFEEPLLDIIDAYGERVLEDG
ncbi:hypothetical protein [Pleionea sp. CnH1-48]|uniref:hypothetical protein n=1 Tax=Pleionea sp. CnH1-48 TaxID=2954494 RepID=UPI00209845E6|nr:hypothetical protein [Pleionea sp. CnH1-48]MCO7227590.1 hypothetical protein [Pleionea sp. CnH1-48]